MPIEYVDIHRRLFQDIYKFAGKIRDYNITKQEWVLNGETILYGSAESLKATLEYDFEQEKSFNYKGLNQQETIEHLARFVAYLWQIHVFGEGNTLTVAIFLIKYLRTFGFNVNNKLFEEHSWYFRNALVRAIYKDHTKNIHATNEYLLRFLGNLLFDENNILKNREMHVHHADTVKKNSSEKSSEKVSGKSSEKILTLISRNELITIAELAEILNITTRGVEKQIKNLKTANRLERVGGDKGGYWKVIEK